MFELHSPPWNSHAPRRRLSYDARPGGNRMSPPRLAVAAALGLLCASAHAQTYRIERIAWGLNQPTFVTQAPGDPANILYFTERTSNTIPGFSVINQMGKVWR